MRNAFVFRLKTPAAPVQALCMELEGRRLDRNSIHRSYTQQISRDMAARSTHHTMTATFITKPGGLHSFRLPTEGSGLSRPRLVGSGTRYLDWRHSWRVWRWGWTASTLKTTPAIWHQPIPSCEPKIEYATLPFIKGQLTRIFVTYSQCILRTHCTARIYMLRVFFLKNQFWKWILHYNW